jgi:hypothetical protein
MLKWQQTTYLLMGQSKHHKGWMDGWWVGMKHFSVGFQFPGYIVAVRQRWTGITNSFGFQAGSHFG